MHSIAIDDGSSHIKYAVSGTKGSFLSMIRTGDQGMVSLNISDKESDATVYKTIEGSYTVSEELSSSSPTGSRNYQTSPESRILVHHAMRKVVGDDDGVISVITSLPFNAFYLPNGSVNSKLVEQKKLNLLNNPVSCSEGVSLSVDRAFVVAEGLAAWFDCSFDYDEKGKVIPNPEYIGKPLAIVDIGGHTTDIVAMKNNSISLDHSTTLADTGMLSVYKSVERSLLSEYTDIESSQISQSALRDSVDNGTPFKLWNDEIDLSDHTKDAKTTLVNTIVSNLRDKLAQGALFEKVVFVGGGASALNGLLEGSFKNMVVHPEPQFANVNGMLKYLQMANQKGNK